MVDIRYHSTNGKAEPVTFAEALMKGLAPDGGLFMPGSLPSFSQDEIYSLRGLSYNETALRILVKFLGDEIGPGQLREMCNSAYNFDVPLEKVHGRNFILRLDRGPTASFKDFAARMMGRLMQHFLREAGKKILILTATSGDTGSAIANAFLGLENIEVVILFPVNEVSERQRKQMTTLGGNVSIIGIDGKFDDCQAYVKQAFMDPELDSLNLTSANSINIGRLLPQSVYYFYSFANLVSREDVPPVFVVPSGNFGDLMGGILARESGLPVRKFIVATNENDEFPVFIETGKYSKVAPSRNCISSAMNVGHPSNLSRLIEIYGGSMDETGKINEMPDMEKMRDDLWSVSISDSETGDTISRVQTQHGTLLEPHGAVGWAALEKYKEITELNSRQLTVTLETAHPAKFPDEIQKHLGFEPELPHSLTGLEEKQEKYDAIENDYGSFKEYITRNYR